MSKNVNVKSSNPSETDKVKNEVRVMQKRKRDLQKSVENLRKLKEAKGNLQAEIDLLTEEQTNLLASIR